MEQHFKPREWNQRDHLVKNLMLTRQWQLIQPSGRFLFVSALKNQDRAMLWRGITLPQNTGKIERSKSVSLLYL